MLVFEYVLILLFAIFLSNFINRFLPSVSVPVIQIILGAMIALLPLNFKLELDPGLFFVLFIAPLVFNSSMLLDRRSFWELKMPIMNMAFLLVFASVFGIGYLVHLMIPSIPLVASFVLIAALAPTDDIAVISMAKKIRIPPKIMNILAGESIINDASGIVSFQFAVLAVVTGSFSIAQAAGSFIIIGLGGVLVGLSFTLLKYLFVRWLRSLGMENVTLHILIELLTPFLIYLIAEKLNVSGILAVFSAGLAHSFWRKQLNPDNAALNFASNSTWDVFSFTLEGLVFLILGTQLPDILRTVQTGTYSISTLQIIMYILIITLIFTVSRFVWSFLTIRRKAYADKAHPISKGRACIIFSLSGARGAVTLASVMSIPVLLSDGSAFPQRDLIILIASGVIICSLLLTNFVLPLFAEKEEPKSKSEEENQAYLEILQNVLRQLSIQSSPENKQAIQIMMREYLKRIRVLRNKQHLPVGNHEYEQNLLEQIHEWGKQNINDMWQRKEIDEYTAVYYLDLMEKRFGKMTKKRRNCSELVKKIVFFIKHIRKFASRDVNRKRRRNKIFIIKRKNDLFILEKLKQQKEQEQNPLIDKYIADYELLLAVQKNVGSSRKKAAGQTNVEEVALLAFQLERDNIQKMFEDGRISRETAKELRNNISLMEIELRS